MVLRQVELGTRMVGEMVGESLVVGVGWSKLLTTTLSSDSEWVWTEGDSD